MAVFSESLPLISVRASPILITFCWKRVLPTDQADNKKPGQARVD
ncbi:hypothetical protein TRICHSKD4_0067 [Roseibium sp. TrichSKD4]|nr:hypothetical protein TRICHSKD4_0067 [Roseibium sp. TrichSKD4]